LRAIAAYWDGDQLGQGRNLHMGHPDAATGRARETMVLAQACFAGAKFHRY